MRDDYEAFQRDFPLATTPFEQADRNLWKYVPEFVARARAAAHFRRVQRELVKLILRFLPKETK